jgi:aminoglycoside phosphotransferase (APT) family kinase protein
MAIAADIFIDEPLVRRLLREQHPDLGTLELRLVANGWDNDIYRLGGDLVVRLPRRLVAVPLVEHEQRWLSGIAERVTVDVPAPVRIGLPSDTFPWPWTVAPWFEGDLGSTTSFADRTRLPPNSHPSSPSCMCRRRRTRHSIPFAACPSQPDTSPSWRGSSQEPLRMPTN